VFYSISTFFATLIKSAKWGWNMPTVFLSQKHLGIEGFSAKIGLFKPYAVGYRSLQHSIFHGLAHITDPEFYIDECVGGLSFCC